MQDTIKQDNTANSKRIAKNTLLLYVRMLFLMLISLYTSRVILNALGVEDYGIYNVVGGVVTMFAILSSSLSAAISRFLTFELGTGNREKLKKVFSSSLTIQIGIALVIVTFAETLGLWFLNEKMFIPSYRVIAANWCYQFSIITFAINLISIPYNAAIIAHERMSAFAYISILEALGKLVIARLIVVNPIDRLVFFGGMVAILAIIVRIIYGWYCKRHFEECTYHFIYDHDMLKQMFGFAGWTFFGNTAGILNSQGVNILSNMFFGVNINASRGIAEKINTVMTQFVNNFMTAMNPQITKSYAQGDHEYMHQLMYSGSRLSCYLLMLFAIPIGFETEYVLKVWLKIVPDYAVVFVRWTLASSLCLTIGNTLLTALLATGDVKRYQITISTITLLGSPLSYLFFKFGYSPSSSYIILFFIYFILIFIRFLLVRRKVSITLRGYIIDVVLKIFMVICLSSILPAIVIYIFEPSLFRFILNIIVCIVSISVIVWILGLSIIEKNIILQALRKVYDKYNKV